MIKCEKQVHEGLNKLKSKDESGVALSASPSSIIPSEIWQTKGASSTGSGRPVHGKKVYHKF